MGCFVFYCYVVGFNGFNFFGNEEEGNFWGKFFVVGEEQDYFVVIVRVGDFFKFDRVFFIMYIDDKSFVDEFIEWKFIYGFFVGNKVGWGIYMCF